MMNMFRDDLLDLNAILDYIKMPPAEETTASASSTVCHSSHTKHCQFHITRQTATGVG